MGGVSQGLVGTGWGRRPGQAKANTSQRAGGGQPVKWGDAERRKQFQKEGVVTAAGSCREIETTRGLRTEVVVTLRAVLEA